MSKGFKGISAERKAEIVEEALQLYCNGTLLKDIAPKYGVSVKTLYRLIVSTSPKGWWAAQQALWWCAAEDALEAGALSGNSQARKLLNRAEWRLNQIDAKRRG
jgi:uncharacterized protein YjcR